MKHMMLFLAFIVTMVWSAEKKDFYGFWVPDFEKALTQIPKKERKQLEDFPIMEKMMRSIVFKIEDGQVSAWVLQSVQKAKCPVFEVKDNVLSVNCIGQNGKSEPLKAELKNGQLFVEKSQSGLGQNFSKLPFVKATEAEAMKIAAQAPSEEDFKQMFTQLMMKAMQQGMGDMGQSGELSSPAKK